MKKFFSTLFLSVFVILAMMTTDVSAYNTYNQHKLTYGVGDYGNSTQYYWIDSSASEFNSYIVGAMNDWIYTTSYWGITTPISYKKTTTQSSSRMRIYQVSTPNEWSGNAEHYIGSTKVDPFTTNWTWGKVILDVDFDYTIAENKKKTIIAHEMGHVVGLRHTARTDALMFEDVGNSYITINRAQPNDLAGINVLY